LLLNEGGKHRAIMVAWSLFFNDREKVIFRGMIDVLWLHFLAEK
jgi:hypothetical protein